MAKEFYNCSLKSGSFSMEFTNACNSACKGNTFGLIGNVNGFEMTDGQINSFYKEMFKFLNNGNKIHYYITEIYQEEIKKNSRAKYLIEHPNTTIHNVVDWNIIGGDMPKFQGVVMNPPFCNGLHLKILETVTEHIDWEHDGKVVCIHPAKWLQFPTRERPTFMNGYIKDFTIVDRKEANTTFEIDDGDMVITELGQNGLSFTGKPTEDPVFNCFKFNSKFDF